MRFIFCVNVKPTMHCVRKSINGFPGFEDMELREKFIYILKHKNRKLPKSLVKACDSRRNLLYENA